MRKYLHTLYELSLRFPRLGSSGTILLHQRQCISSSIRFKVHGCFVICSKGRIRRRIRSMLWSSLTRIGATQLLLHLFFSREKTKRGTMSIKYDIVLLSRVTQNLMSYESSQSRLTSVEDMQQPIPQLIDKPVIK